MPFASFSQPFLIDPEFDLPKFTDGDIERLSINDKVDGKIFFEVIGKSKSTIRIRINTVRLNQKKRLVT